MIFLVLAVSMVVVMTVGSSCPKYQVAHLAPDNSTVCCLPVIFCGVDHQVVNCAQNGSKDECKPGIPGMRNSYNSSSLDENRKMCFLYMEKKHDVCPPEDTLIIDTSMATDGMACRYDETQCFFGVPARHSRKVRECAKDEELNGLTGECTPCGPLRYKPDLCGSCVWNETAWRLSQDKKIRPVSPDVSGTITDDPTVNMENTSEDNSPVGSKGYDIQIDNSTGSVEASSETAEKQDNNLVAVVVPVILVVVIVAVVIAIFLYVKRQIKKGDNHSMIVRFYHRVLPRKGAEYTDGIQHAAGQQDEELGMDLNSRPEGRGQCSRQDSPRFNSTDKPRQIVAPMQRGASQDDSYLNGDASIPYQDMSMLPSSPDACTEEDHNTSVPLLDSGACAQSMDQTNQKSP
ncbi:uncharacterized protein LOC128246864 isoform X2 [Mya arenaria]|uniref:uncharacterized protein LOC128246864 isoform X2 n=1 Tax=Mya arenaria TaxID=6604 RepID=UPI0022E8FE72|nr:uncharacterized protein LOC128246864 isoform X2 [Mya arenaria]